MTQQVDTLDTYQLPNSNFGFSAAKLDDLGASEYTLVGIAMDESSSVEDFAKDLNKCIQTIVKTCRHSPRADNLMLRLTAFGSRLREVHGFKLLQNCNEADYNDVYQNGGATALFQAALNGVESIASYATTLSASDYLANGILFVLTDGDDNQGGATPRQIKDAVEKIRKSESLESMITILIGVNVADSGMKQYLDKFHKEAGFTQFVALENASKSTLAKLADFVSRSISSQSQALGTGGPSQSLTF